MSEFELRRKLKALKVDREPSRDLWAGIQGQLSGVEPWRPAHRSRHMLWPWATAASVALAVIAGLWISQRLAPVAADRVATTASSGVGEGREIAQNGGAASEPGRAAYSAPPLLEREADAMRVSYEAAIAATRSDASAREAVRPDFVAAGRELDAAAASLRGAIAQDPQATYLLELLRRTEERRLSLARLVAAA